MADFGAPKKKRGGLSWLRTALLAAMAALGFASSAAAQDTNWFAFEHFDGSYSERAKTPDGWLVRVWNGVGYSVTYVPDAGHTWTLNPAPYALNPPTRIGRLMQYKVIDNQAIGLFHFIWINLDQVVEIEPSKGDPQNPTTITTTKGGPYNVADFDPTKLVMPPPYK